MYLFIYLFIVIHSDDIFQLYVCFLALAIPSTFFHASADS